MKGLIIIHAIFISFLLISCGKDNSNENNNGNDPSIIGLNCRISKVVYSDSATGVGLGSIAALIDINDQATDITRFDSLSGTRDFNAQPGYSGGRAYINSIEYFEPGNSATPVNKFHGLTDPSNLSSPPFDAIYLYNSNGNLVKKTYSRSATPGINYKVVDYSYTANNLTKMTEVDVITGDKITDADITYMPAMSPKNFLYIFPDEEDYGEYNQFYNFGKRSSKAVQSLIVRYYAPGNVLIDSSVSTFNNYLSSTDNYILQVNMSGDAQSFIPAIKGRLTFSYNCK